MNQREEFYHLQNIAKTYRIAYQEVEHGYKVLVEELGYTRDNAISSLEATFAQLEHSKEEDRHRTRKTK